MDLLFVAAGVHPPWTEGRKNMVRDLSDELRSRGVGVRVISGNGGPMSVANLATVLWRLCHSLVAARPTHVIQFPFGRFSGVRGRINRVVALCVRFVSGVAGVPLLTVIYSADGIRLDRARQLFGRLAAVGTETPGVSFLHLGVAPTAFADDMESQDRLGDLLFLCGYQTPSKAAIEGVMNERGLRHLLQACGQIKRPLVLTIAVPFLRDSRARELIAQAALDLCPNVTVRMDWSLQPAEALRRHDLFVFPYLAEHQVFVSTALLEAMLIGTPVVATDRRMYRALTCPDGVPRCVLTRDDTASALGDAIRDCLEALPEAHRQAMARSDEIRAGWSKARMADDLLVALQARN